MNLTLTINSGNSAVENPEDMAILLEEVATLIAENSTAGKIRDYNGNTVGSWSIS